MLRLEGERRVERCGGVSTFRMPAMILRYPPSLGDYSAGFVLGQGIVRIPTINGLSESQLIGGDRDEQ